MGARVGSCLLAPAAWGCNTLQGVGFSKALFERAYNLQARDAWPVFLNTRFSRALWPLLTELRRLAFFRLDDLDPGRSLREKLDCLGQRDAIGGLDFEAF